MERVEPASRVAPGLILTCLIRQECRFEELATILKGQLCRATVSKYLTDLFDSKNEFKGFVKRRGRRGAYYIPNEKRSKVELFLKREETKRDINTVIDTFIDNATKEELEAWRRDSEDYREILEVLRDPKKLKKFTRLLEE